MHLSKLLGEQFCFRCGDRSGHRRNLENLDSAAGGAFPEAATRRGAEAADRAVLFKSSVKEIAQLTGWSVPLVKVRAFRARAEMRKILSKMAKDQYL